MNQREEAWHQKLSKEVEKRRKIQELYKQVVRSDKRVVRENGPTVGSRISFSFQYFSFAMSTTLTITMTETGRQHRSIYTRSDCSHLIAPHN